jgi:hypothetical protein
MGVFPFSPFSTHKWSRCSYFHSLKPTAAAAPPPPPHSTLTAAAPLTCRRHVGDGRYRHVGHQQDRRASDRENQTVQSTKPDHPISQEAVAAPSHQHELEASKSGSSANQSGGSQGQTRLRSEISVDGEAKPDVERSLEEVAAKQNKVSGVKTETRMEAGTSLRQPQNRTVRFPKLDHPVSIAPGQKRPSRTTTPRIAPAPCWCPPGLTPSQRRSIEWMWVEKMREEVAGKERDEYFNIIRPVILTKREWRVKEKVNTPAPMTSDDDMDLLDDDEAPLIKDGSLPPTGMYINMVFTLSAEFRGEEEDVAHMCLRPKEAMFEKPEESNQYLNPLHIRGHIDGKSISRMLIDGDAAVNLVPYSVFKKLGREDDELVKTNLMVNGVGGNPMEARGVISMELTVGSKSLTTAFFIVEVQSNYSVILGCDWIHANRCISSTLH